jgi:hypothetical protein
VFNNLYLQLIFHIIRRLSLLRYISLLSLGRATYFPFFTYIIYIGLHVYISHKIGHTNNCMSLVLSLVTQLITNQTGITIHVAMMDELVLQHDVM